jgi:hypothetical protein
MKSNRYSKSKVKTVLVTLTGKSLVTWTDRATGLWCGPFWKDSLLAELEKVEPKTEREREREGERESNNFAINGGVGWVALVGDFLFLMESCSSLRSFCVTLKPPLLNSVGVFASTHSSWRRKRASFQVSAFSFQKFIHFALNETKRQTQLVPSPLQVHICIVLSLS